MDSLINRKVEDFSLTENQKEVLRRKDRIAEKAKEIISILSNTQLAVSEEDNLKIKHNFVDICNDVGAIGSLAGGKVADKINDGLDNLRRNLMLTQGLSEIGSIQLVYMEPMLLELVGLAIKFDKGRAVDIGFDVEPMSGKFGGRFSRGK